MFDIGWSELLTVLVVALVVVGPKDLPRLMRMVGRWVGKARGMADQFRKSFDELAQESELDELRAEIAALRRANPLNDIHADLNRSILPPETQAAEVDDTGVGHTAEEAPQEELGEKPDDNSEPEKPPVPPDSEPSAS